MRRGDFFYRHEPTEPVPEGVGYGRGREGNEDDKRKVEFLLNAEINGRQKDGFAAEKQTDEYKPVGVSEDKLRYHNSKIISFPLEFPRNPSGARQKSF